MKPLSPAQLRTLWVWLTRRYFPAWLNAVNWQVFLRPAGQWTDPSGMVHSKDEAGYCHQEKRRISINTSYIQQIRAIMIHEAVHASGCAYHGIEFCQKMLMVGDRAEKLGDAGLARAVREDVYTHPRGKVAEELLRNGHIMR